MQSNRDDESIGHEMLLALRNQLSIEAKATPFEFQVDGNILSNIPEGVYGKVFLRLSCDIRSGDLIIEQHRNPMLTLQYKGRGISYGWVIKFLDHHCRAAEDYVRNYKNQVRKRKNAEQKELHQIQKRNRYLGEREKVYRELSEKELDELWTKKREELKDDELTILREIVRERKGIKPASKVDIPICRGCGMIDINCMCSRS